MKNTPQPLKLSTPISPRLVLWMLDFARGSPALVCSRRVRADARLAVSLHTGAARWLIAAPSQLVRVELASLLATAHREATGEYLRCIEHQDRYMMLEPDPQATQPRLFVPILPGEVP